MAGVSVSPGPETDLPRYRRPSIISQAAGCPGDTKGRLRERTPQKADLGIFWDPDNRFPRCAAPSESSLAVSGAPYSIAGRASRFLDTNHSTHKHNQS